VTLVAITKKTIKAFARIAVMKKSGGDVVSNYHCKTCNVDMVTMFAGGKAYAVCPTCDVKVENKRIATYCDGTDQEHDWDIEYFQNHPIKVCKRCRFRKSQIA